LKYKIDCKSLLLQKALEEFLKEYISEDGVIISDEEGDIIIGKDIKKPFTKSQLLIQLEAIHQKHQIHDKMEEKLEIDMSIFDELVQKEEKSFNKNIEISFEEKLDNLIDNFTTELKKLIKDEYGKK